MTIYDVDAELDRDGEAIARDGDENPIYVSRAMFEKLADAFGLAVIRLPIPKA